jgi:phenylpyruvate tautomerase PptA (4-oxalocrotonate tautomerase family)
MPNIVLKIPKNAFPAEHRAALVQRIHEAAASVERIPADPAKRFLSWVLVDEIDPADWTCGGADVSRRFIPCLVIVHLPAGVLDDDARSRYASEVQAAFQESLPPQERRQLLTSLVLNEVADGTWGVNGKIWRLPQFAHAAGYAHLQHLLGDWSATASA